MRPPRIVNRGRIAQEPPPTIIDSGRNSFSSASAVSNIDDNDVEPEKNIPQEAAQKLEQSIATSSMKKKVIIFVSICATLLVLFGLAFGIAYPLTVGKHLPTPTATIEKPPEPGGGGNNTQTKI